MRRGRRRRRRRMGTKKNRRRTKRTAGREKNTQETGPPRTQTPGVRSGHRGLQAARQTGPGPTSVDRELRALPVGGEPKKLPEELGPFNTNPTGGFENQRTKLKASAPKARVILAVLMGLSIRVGRGGRTETGDTERGGDRHIDGQTLATTPDGDLKDGAQVTLLTHLFNQVSDTIVSYNQIPVPLAATGVIAKNVKGLHAKWAGEGERDNRKTQTVGNRGPKNLGAHDRLVPVLCRGDGRDEGAGVRLEKTTEALAITWTCAIYQRLVDGLINGKRGLLLRTLKQESGGGDDPRFTRSALRLTKTSGVRRRRVNGRTAKAHTTEGWGKARLEVHILGERTTEDGLCRQTYLAIKLLRLDLPLIEWCRTHEVRGADDAV